MESIVTKIKIESFEKFLILLILFRDIRDVKRKRDVKQNNNDHDISLRKK